MTFEIKREVKFTEFDIEEIKQKIDELIADYLYDKLQEFDIIYSSVSQDDLDLMKAFIKSKAFNK